MVTIVLGFWIFVKTLENNIHNSKFYIWYAYASNNYFHGIIYRSLFYGKHGTKWIPLFIRSVLTALAPNSAPTWGVWIRCYPDCIDLGNDWVHSSARQTWANISYCSNTSFAWLIAMELLVWLVCLWLRFIRIHMLVRLYGNQELSDKCLLTQNCFWNRLWPISN